MKVNNASQTLGSGAQREPGTDDRKLANEHPFLRFAVWAYAVVHPPWDRTNQTHSPAKDMVGNRVRVNEFIIIIILRDENSAKVDKHANQQLAKTMSLSIATEAGGYAEGEK